MAEQLDKIYNPKEVEDRLYENWVEKGYFTPTPDPDKKPFTIVIPPPNVTGQLHMGHAMDETLQDILIRYKRMAGFSTLWVPGTDHAGIATQIKVEETLRKEEGLTRYDLGREAFTERVWDWKHKFGTRIINQLKKLGSSCDWTRERFTMDENLSKAVKEVFVTLYEKGLIYQGERIINWCPRCITALSDAEVEYAEQGGCFWYIRYPVKDSDESFVIATTRPETMLGDVAVAVHPEDERYQHLVGKSLILPLTGREIPIIADDYVDKEFGTGAVKITPAHDPNDFEIGVRHNLPTIKVLDDNAKMNENGGKYQGLDRYEARRQVVEDLEKEGFLVKTEDHVHNVGQCYRCGTTVEPITSRQWFVKMAPLAEKALEVVKDGTISFVPDRFSKTYINWMENVHDWCISRQLWWGHRIPAYYCDACGKTVVSREDVTVCPDCGAPMRQDEDVLDTWFSSALWPFSTLGWPDETEDLKYFYPTSVLVTGYDIIFFWVARMIFSAMENMGQEPFRHVLIHGLVRDSQGRKMSKSLGNGVDPLEVIEKYGADALRMTLVTGNSPGNDMRYSDERVEASRNFANKIWNASRFVLMNLTISERSLPDASELTMEDKWILNQYNNLVKAVTENLEKFELGIALGKLYDFIWDEFCDWYIELIKPRLYDEDCPSNKAAQQVLSYVLSGALELLHPFMPFITEEIWQKLPHEGESIVIAKWPTYDSALSFAEEAHNMELIMNALKAVRNQRSEMNIPPSKKATVYIKTDKQAVFSQGTLFFEKLASAQEAIVVDAGFAVPENAVSCVVDGAQIFMPLDDLVDKEKELARLKKEEERLLSEIKRVEGKLNNQGFVAKAPAHVVEEEKKKEEKYREMLDKVLESIKLYQ
ncbi:MAG: valine--tRNA ligase [Ruminococcaceae bacterium]|nr:valine--tRNA ligase [Oscillospiraceae bacterium]